MEITLPPITNGEQDFYTKKILAKTYDEDKNYQTTVVEPMLDQHNDICEPQLHFHEFVFLMNLIAWNCIDSRDTIKGKLEFFYEDKLKFKRPSESQAARDLSYEEVLMRTQMDIAPGKQSEASEEEMEYTEETYESEEDNSNPQTQMMNLINQKTMQSDSIAMDWEHIVATLDKDLPKIP